MQEILGLVRRCIEDYDMIKEGESIAVGISGGKDSTVCASLCVNALGPARVIGVLMPNGDQIDINDSYEVCTLLGIKPILINLASTYASMVSEFTKAGFSGSYRNECFKTNTPARLRMATLYGVAAMIGDCRVCNTCNRSEDYVGYSTKFGDSAGDFSPLSSLTVREVLHLGADLGLPSRLIDKVPSDGMSGKSDEEKLGFTYDELDEFLLNGVYPAPEVLTKIECLHKMNVHKMLPMPRFTKT